MMLTIEVELLGPLMLEDRLRQAELRHFRATYADDSNLLLQMIGATGSGLVRFGCRLQALAQHPCHDASVNPADLIVDCSR